MLTPKIIEDSIKKFKPEGVEIVAIQPHGYRLRIDNIEFRVYPNKLDGKPHPLYPHLLTRLIEAINKNSVVTVNYRHPSYQIFKTTYLEPDECFDAEADPDLAKEEVIKYVMENL